MLQLTRENYHSIEANREYMNRSQYEMFLECEAMAMGYLYGGWYMESTDELLAGSLLHSWNEGTIEQFKKDHPEMYSSRGATKGELKAPFQIVNKMITTLEEDPLAMYMLEGDKEVILTAEFAGAVWKVMLDVYNLERGRIVDLKTTKSIREKHWSQKHGGKVSFIEEYNYPLQAALYSEIERRANSDRPMFKWLDFYIVAVSKETYPDKAIVEMNDYARYVDELAKIEISMSRILAVKSKQVNPSRCEKCDFCKYTRKLMGSIHYSDL